MNEIEKAILTGNQIKLKAGQWRILKVLARARGPITVEMMIERADLSNPGWVSWFCGSTTDEMNNQIAQSSGFPSLAILGAVRVEQIDNDGINTRVFSITQRGRDMLAAHKDEE